MKRMMLLPLIAAVVMPVITGCGVSQGKIDECDAKLKQLEAQGVPDSVLSDVKIYLQQAKDGMMRHDDGFANTGYDSTRICLKKAEAFYKSESDRMSTDLTNLMASLKSQAAQLKGLHRTPVDSAIAVADSLIKAGKSFDAEPKAKLIQKLIDTMKVCETRADTIAPKVPGVWKSTEKAVSVECKQVNAVTTKIFNLKSDGTAMLIETKKGQSTKNLKEDWEFDSWGKWGIRGDTIFLSITRFAAKKQDFTPYHEDTKKWVLDRKPTFDSTITDHSQDRNVTWSDLLLDFKK